MITDPPTFAGWLAIACGLAIGLACWWGLRRDRERFDREMRDVLRKDDLP